MQRIKMQKSLIRVISILIKLETMPDENFAPLIHQNSIKYSEALQEFAVKKVAIL